MHLEEDKAGPHCLQVMEFQVKRSREVREDMLFSQPGFESTQEHPRRR